MRKWTKSSSFLFLAAASVYPVSVILAAPASKAPEGSGGNSAATEVRLLDETAGPVAESPAAASSEASAPTTPVTPAIVTVTEAEVAAPAATQPAGDGAAAPTTQPVGATAGDEATQITPVAITPVGDVPEAKATEGTSASAPQVNVSDAGTVELHVNEANLVEVLRMLSMQSQRNIIASKDVKGTVTANLYDVTIREALDAILKANGYAYREKGNFIFVYTAKELAEIEKAERRTTAEVFRLHYTPVANAVGLIKPLMSPEGQASFSTAAKEGVASGNSETGGNSHADSDILIVRDYPENLDWVRKALREIDRRPQQVMVEATIIAARMTEDNALGIDFNILGGVDFASLVSSNGQITNAKLPDTATPGRIHSVGSGNNFTSPINNGFRVGFVSSNVSVFLSALEEVADTSVLANPKVLTLNKQKGEVLVGREDGYITTTVTDTTAVQTVEFLKTGTRLIFRPFIADDGYVRLEVHPEDSDGKVVGGLPEKTTTEVTTNIMVKDGHTVVIGGLFRESSATSRRQVPGLGNLPLVGALFRNQQDATVREEIIIMLTPHIIKDDRAFAKASEEALREAEKLRVGVRKGMMFFGRERLAEGSYQNAVNEMAKPNPDRDKALWYLDCAVNLNPLFAEAVRMKEELTGKAVTSVDNSTVRHFVRKQILAERGTATTPAPAAQAPATRPAAADLAGVTAPATTQPAVAGTETPTTQPAVAEADGASPATQPTEDPAVANVGEEPFDFNGPMDDPAAAEEPSDEWEDWWWMEEDDGTVEPMADEPDATEPVAEPSKD